MQESDFQGFIDFPERRKDVQILFQSLYSHIPNFNSSIKSTIQSKNIASKCENILPQSQYFLPKSISANGDGCCSTDNFILSSSQFDYKTEHFIKQSSLIQTNSLAHNSDSGNFCCSSEKHTDASSTNLDKHSSTNTIPLLNTSTLLYSTPQSYINKAEDSGRISNQHSTNNGSHFCNKTELKAHVVDLPVLTDETISTIGAKLINQSNSSQVLTSEPKRSSAFLGFQGKSLHLINEHRLMFYIKTFPRWSCNNIRLFNLHRLIEFRKLSYSTSDGKSNQTGHSKHKKKKKKSSSKSSMMNDDKYLGKSILENGSKRKIPSIENEFNRKIAIKEVDAKCKKLVIENISKSTTFMAENEVKCKNQTESESKRKKIVYDNEPKLNKSTDECELKSKKIVTENEMKSNRQITENEYKHQVRSTLKDDVNFAKKLSMASNNCNENPRLKLDSVPTEKTSEFVRNNDTFKKQTCSFAPPDKSPPSPSSSYSPASPPREDDVMDHTNSLPLFVKSSRELSSVPIDISRPTAVVHPRCLVNFETFNSSNSSRRPSLDERINILLAGSSSSRISTGSVVTSTIVSPVSVCSVVSRPMTKPVISNPPRLANSVVKPYGTSVSLSSGRIADINVKLDVTNNVTNAPTTRRSIVAQRNILPTCPPPKPVPGAWRLVVPPKTISSAPITSLNINSANKSLSDSKLSLRSKQLDPFTPRQPESENMLSNSFMPILVPPPVTAYPPPAIFPPLNNVALPNSRPPTLHVSSSQPTRQRPSLAIIEYNHGSVGSIVIAGDPSTSCQPSLNCSSVSSTSTQTVVSRQQTGTVLDHPGATSATLDYRQFRPLCPPPTVLDARAHVSSQLHTQLANNPLSTTS